MSDPHSRQCREASLPGNFCWFCAFNHCHMMSVCRTRAVHTMHDMSSYKSCMCCDTPHVCLKHQALLHQHEDTFTICVRINLIQRPSIRPTPSVLCWQHQPAIWLAFCNFHGMASLTFENATCDCRIFRDSSCQAQGVTLGTTDDDEKCNTASYLCKAPVSGTVKPCCTPCGSVPGSSGGSPWFWQCILPRSSSSVTYTFEVLAGQFYPVGTCDVTVAGSQVSVANCNIATPWSATAAEFYLSGQSSDTCSPGQVKGDTDTGIGFEFAPTTGALSGVTWSNTVDVSAPYVYVYMHMNVQT